MVYGTIIPQSASFRKGLEGKYGVKLEYWRADATKVVDRALTEKRHGTPDSIS